MCTWTRVHTELHAQASVCLHMCVTTYVCVCTYVHVHTCARAEVGLYVHVFIRARMCSGA